MKTRKRPQSPHQSAIERLASQLRRNPNLRYSLRRARTAAKQMLQGGAA